MKYLLDTNVLVEILRRNQTVIARLRQSGKGSCAISVVSVAELLAGVELSADPVKNLLAVDELVSHFDVLPLAGVTHEFARQKVRLRRSRQLIEDFDLLIGTTAVVHRLMLVTNKSKHLGRVEGVVMEDWSR